MKSFFAFLLLLSAAFSAATAQSVATADTQSKTWELTPALSYSQTAYEDGTYQRSINSLSLPDQDMKHDNPLGLRVGGIYDFDSFRLKATLALISEQSLHLGAGFRF